MTPELKYSQIALLLYSFALVVFSGMEATTMIENYIGAALVGVFFLECSINKNLTFRWHWTMGFLLLFIAFAFVALAFNPESIRRFITVILVMILFFVVYNIVSETRSFLPIAIGLTIGLLYTSITQFDQILLSLDGVSQERLSGLIGNANDYAFYLVATPLILFLPVIGKYDINPVVRYTIYVIILIFSILLVTTTGSRKGTILLSFALIATFFLMTKKETLLVKLRYVVVFSVVTVFLFNLLSESAFFIRFENIFLYSKGEEINEQSLEIRDNMISTALIMWKEKPLAGWGLDSFRVHSGFGTYSHNNYTELLFNQGLIGLSLYYGFFISLLFICKKLLKRFKHNDKYRIVGWAIICLLILLMWDFAAVSYYDKKYWLFAGVILGVLVNVEEPK